MEQQQEFDRLEQEKEIEKKNAAAVKIQAMYRGYDARFMLQWMKERKQEEEVQEMMMIMEQQNQQQQGKQENQNQNDDDDDKEEL